MIRYRKKPVVIEAMQFSGENMQECREFCNKFASTRCIPKKYVIVTLEGHMEVSVGDYIIKGVQGEFYPCKPDIFKQTYEVA